MKNILEKGTEKTRREPPVFEFKGEVPHVRLALTRLTSSQIEVFQDAFQLGYLASYFGQFFLT